MKTSRQDQNDQTDQDDAVDAKPATGHSDADSQAQRNTEDESPS